MEAAVDSEIQKFGDGLKVRLLALLDEAQRQAGDNYRAAHPLATDMVAASFQSQENDKYSGKEGACPDLATENESETISETEHEIEGQISAKSIQFASQAFPHNSVYSAESSLEESVILRMTTANCTIYSMADMNPPFGMSIQEVPVRQSELGGLEYRYEDWLTGADNVDWNLPFSDFGLQTRDNVDMGS